MAKTLQFRRGSSAELDQVTGAEGELFVDLDDATVRVSDGQTAGGTKLATEGYADAAEADAKQHANSQAATALTDANQYTDSRLDSGITKTFVTNEEVTITAPVTPTTPILSVTKEVPQEAESVLDWQVDASGSAFDIEDSAYSTTLTPDNATSDGVFTLGSGSFDQTDIGKMISGNGGKAQLTAADGSYKLIEPFADTSAIAAGNWSMVSLDVSVDGLSPTFSLERFSAQLDSGVMYDPNHGWSIGYLEFSPDGTKVFHKQTNYYRMLERTLSSPFASLEETVDSSLVDVFSIEFARAFGFSADGTEFYGIGHNSTQSMTRYSLSSPYSLSGLQESGGGSLHGPEDYSEVNDFQFLPTNLSYVYTLANKNGVFTGDVVILVHEVSDPGKLLSNTYRAGWDVTPRLDDPSFGDFGATDASIRNIRISADGTKLFLVGTANGGGNRLYGAYWVYSINPDDLSVAPTFVESVKFVFYEAATNHGDPIPEGATVIPAIETTAPFIQLNFSLNGEVIYGVFTGEYDPEYRWSAETIQAYAEPSVGITNVGGQIDTSFWTDIASPSIPEVQLNDGNASFAISTDDKQTWKVSRGAGARSIARENNGTWEYNDFEQVNYYDFSQSEAIFGATYETRSEVDGFLSRHSVFNHDGTKVISIDENANGIGDARESFIRQADLSTPYDLSTHSTPVGISFANNGIDIPIYFGAGAFNNDGTKFYFYKGNDESSYGIVGNTLYEINVPTPGDLTSVSGDPFASSVSLTIPTPTGTVNSEGHGVQGLQFSSDGSKMFFLFINDVLSERSLLSVDLNTPFDISTATNPTLHNTISNIPQDAARNFGFVDGGNRLVVTAYDASYLGIYVYDLSVAYDLSTAVFNASESNLQLRLGLDYTSHAQPLFTDSNEEFYIISNHLYKYTMVSRPFTTQENWVQAPENSAYSALSSAHIISINRADASQFSAGINAGDFVLGDTLDLAITLKPKDAKSTPPAFQGAALTYDANALDDVAVLGQDYTYKYMGNGEIYFKSLGDYNLKVRAI